MTLPLSVIRCMEAQARAAKLAAEVTSRLDMISGRARLAHTLIAKPPCRYCGRTSQTASHVNCDGCGAPKETGGVDPKDLCRLPTHEAQHGEYLIPHRVPVFVSSEQVVRLIHG